MKERGGKPPLQSMKTLEEAKKVLADLKNRGEEAVGIVTLAEDGGLRFIAYENGKAGYVSGPAGNLTMFELSPDGSLRAICTTTSPGPKPKKGKPDAK